MTLKEKNITKASKKCPVGLKEVQPFIQIYLRKIPLVPKKFSNAMRNILPTEGELYEMSHGNLPLTQNSNRHTSMIEVEI